MVRTLRWLEANAGPERVESFIVGLETVRRRLTAFPLIGSAVWRSPRSIVRMLPFPHPLPYVVYYRHSVEEPVVLIELIRLFGATQDRPA